MWMTDYINAIRRGFRDDYGFAPLPGGTENEPVIDAPDGAYPMTIEGRGDSVVIKDGKIYCCNFAQ